MTFDDPNSTANKRRGLSAAGGRTTAAGTGTGIVSAQLPPLAGSLPHLNARGETLRVEGTNVVRVPFGVRRPRRARPARPERWVTVVLPFQAGGSTPPPPQAA
ncbi:MAG: hypothetical protein ACO3FA_11580 [Vulcanococcus sp.]|jgi:hypothetical protein